MAEKKPKSVAINIRGGSDIVVKDNIAFGTDELLRTTDTNSLTASGNVHIHKTPTRTHWYQSLSGKIIVGVVILVLGALIINYLGLSQ